MADRVNVLVWSVYVRPLGTLCVDSLTGLEEGKQAEC